MVTDPTLNTVSKTSLWAGRIISGLCALLFLSDAIAKLMRPAMVVEGTVKMGYSESVILPLGVVLLGSTLLYIIPHTAVLGAILLTGYLGGAVDAHVHAGDALFSHILLPVYLGILVWLGLYLRSRRIRSITPFWH